MFNRRNFAQKLASFLPLPFLLPSNKIEETTEVESLKRDLAEQWGIARDLIQERDEKIRDLEKKLGIGLANNPEGLVVIEFVNIRSEWRTNIRQFDDLFNEMSLSGEREKKFYAWVDEAYACSQFNTEIKMGELFWGKVEASIYLNEATIHSSRALKTINLSKIDESNVEVCKRGNLPFYSTWESNV